MQEIGRGAFGISAADWLQQSLDKSLVIPVGVKGIDDLLGGGIQSQQILELVGQTATGKTQLCLHCILHTVVTADDVTAVYIDTGNSFSPTRMAEMFASQVEMQDDHNDEDLAPEESPEEFLAHVLSKIECYQAYEAFQMLEILESIYEQLKAQKAPFYRSLRLIVIDSLAAVISPILGGKQKIAHSVMMQISRLMRVIAHEFHVAIVYTNYTVTSGFTEGRSDLYKPALGESWLSVPHSRLVLSHRIAQDIRQVELVKSTAMPCGGPKFFAITISGINDVNIL